MHHIEPLAAQGSETILTSKGVTPGDTDRIATHALHVLNEQGVFAFGLFLATRKRSQDQAPANAIHEAVTTLLHSLKLIDANDLQRADRDRIGFYRRLTEIRENEDAASALQRLLLTKEVIDTLLSYTRYAAKAQT